MSKFKAGDKVRANRDLGDGTILTGEIYTCIELSSLYPKDMIRVKGTNGKVNGWNIVCFDLVEKIKHYKWQFEVHYTTPDGDLHVLKYDETKHYVSDEKIDAYIEYLINFKEVNIFSKICQRLDDKFVEE